MSEISELMAGLDAVETHDERRESPRVSFTTDLPITKWNGKNLPTVESFLKVQTKDLSQTGIAFYSHTKPPAKQACRTRFPR